MNNRNKYWVAWRQLIECITMSPYCKATQYRRRAGQKLQIGLAEYSKWSLYEAISHEWINQETKGYSMTMTSFRLHGVQFHTQQRSSLRRSVYDRILPQSTYLTKWRRQLLMALYAPSSQVSTRIAGNTWRDSQSIGRCACLLHTCVSYRPTYMPTFNF